MNLYKIIIEHFSEHDSEEGILTYVVAKSDTKVYEWLESDPDIGGKKYCSLYCNNSFSKIKTENIIKNRGMINTEYAECLLRNLAYGQTLDRWKLIKENVDMQIIREIKDIGIEIIIIN